jgi:hypothetical protein
MCGASRAGAGGVRRCTFHPVIQRLSVSVLLCLSINSMVVGVNCRFPAPARPSALRRTSVRVPRTLTKFVTGPANQGVVGSRLLGSVANGAIEFDEPLRQAAAARARCRRRQWPRIGLVARCEAASFRLPSSAQGPPESAWPGCASRVGLRRRIASAEPPGIGVRGVEHEVRVERDVRATVDQRQHGVRGDVG